MVWYSHDPAGAGYWKTGDPTITGGTGQSLIQSSTFTNSNNLAYQHTITPGVVALTQSARFDNSNSLALQHSVLATITLTQSTTFNDSDNLTYTHNLQQAQGLTQTSRFDNSPLFLAHSISVGPVTLTQTSRFDNTAQFFAHTSLAYVQLVAGLFEDLPIPPDTSGIQLDLTTGQLAIRVTPSLIILL